MKRYSSWLLMLACFLTAALVVIGGCSSNSGSLTNVVSPPSTVTSVNIGASGVTAQASSTSVTLYPTVVDQSNTAITNLLSGNFTITISDNGGAAQSCTITTVTNQTNTGATPISIGMTLDRSGSMTTTDIASLQVAAKAFVDLMGTTDQLGIIEFDDVITTLEALTTTSSTTVKNTIKTLIDTLTSRGLTALYQAMAVTVDLVYPGTNSRKAVIAMTDGGENSSSITFDTTAEVIAYAKAKNIPIYTIGMGTYVSSAELTAIADQTGGMYFGATTSADLQSLYTKISNALSSAYTIQITSPVTLTAGHTYTITVNIANYGGYTGSAVFTLTL